MKYYLIIGYQLLEKHKEFPTVRVYINEQLIDEFECDNEQATEISIQERAEVKAYGKCHTMGRDTIDTFKYSTPAKYKVIELDSSTWLDNGELMIEVSNNNSNYNNGFMNKRSIVSFGTILLIRKDVLDDKSKMLRIIKKFYYSERNLHLRNRRSSWSLQGNQPRWPGLSNYPGEHLGFQDSISLTSGGNFNLQCKIKKKHKMHILIKDTVETKGYFCMDRFFVAWYQYYSKNYFDMAGQRVHNHTKNVEKLEIEIKERLKE